MRNNFVLVMAAVAAFAANPDYTAEGKRWWSHVEVLAADNMEGRNTGSEGYRKAAEYVRSQFEKAGLKPAGTNGYFQPMKFDVAQIVEDQSSVALVRNGKTEPLKLGEDAVISLRRDLAPSVGAPLVFAGYGLVIPEANHNDLAGLDLKSKIAVILAGGPRSVSSELRAHYSSIGERWAAFAAHPTVNTASVVADINLDMYLPLFPLRVLEVQGVNESTLGDEVRAAARDYGVEVQSDREPDRNLFIRSDQYSFVRRGVPALAFKFGYEPGTPEEKVAKEWLKNRYHAPSDDLNQPVDKAAAAKFNRILLDLTQRVANADQRPQWNSKSFFRRFASGTS